MYAERIGDRRPRLPIRTLPEPDLLVMAFAARPLSPAVHELNRRQITEVYSVGVDVTGLENSVGAALAVVTTLPNADARPTITSTTA